MAMAKKVGANRLRPDGNRGGGGVTLPTWTKIQLCQSVGKGQKEDKSALDLAGVKHEIFVKAHLSFLYELTTIF